MNLETAALVIVVGIAVVCWPAVTDPPLTFEQRFAPAKVLMEPVKERELTFEERWEPVKQLQRMQLPEVVPEPRIIPVRTITIRPEPAVYIEPPEQPAPRTVPVPVPREHPKARTIRKASLDICQRHNMHKQVTRGGKSWRCRK